MPFDSIYPFTADQVLTRAQRSENPGAVLHKGIKLEVHGMLPVRIFVGNGKARWFNHVWIRLGFGKEGSGDGVAYSAVSEVFGLGYVVFGSGGHGMGWILGLIVCRRGGKGTVCREQRGGVFRGRRR